MRDRNLTTLSPKNWPFSLEWLPKTAYMVGGAVRDALLGRQSEYLDLDFVLPSKAVNTARQIASHYQAGFVLLDAERQIARVVFKQGTVDFAQQEGETIEIDLHRRDFTVNAIAYNPHTNDLIDPLEGCADLQQRIMRMISPANLQDDPLRLLRAYRQAAQLGFTIAPETRSAIRQLAPFLGEIAAERVRVEFGYLLATSQGSIWLKTACEDGLLTTWFPNTTSDRLDLLATVDRSGELLAETWPELRQLLSTWIEKTIKTSWLAIAKLATLVDPDTAEAELLHLKYSRVEIKAAIAILKYLPKLSSPIAVREQYFLFRELGFVFPSLAVVAVANGIELATVAPLIDCYLNPEDRVAHPIQLVSGKDLMSALNLPAGRQIGELISEIQVAQAEGRISSYEEALELAANLL